MKNSACKGKVSYYCESEAFRKAAQQIFNSCKILLSSDCGYVALVSEDGTENKAIYLDPGELKCSVDPSLPMPIRGLRQWVYKSGKAVYENSLPDSRWMKLLPPGHAQIENVLIAPLIIEDSTVGLIGLANKEGGFTDLDAEVATSFGRLAAVTLQSVCLMEEFEAEKARFYSVVEACGDAVICTDSSGDVVHWNGGAQELFGFEESEILGNSISLIIPEEIRDKHSAAVSRAVETGKSKVIGRVVEVQGLRKDGTLIPLEVSVNTWKNRNEVFFTAIYRDISERKFTENILRSTEEKFRNAFDNAAVGMVIVTKDGEFVQTNKAFCNMIGYSQLALRNKNIIEITHPDDRGIVESYLSRLLNGEISSFQIEKRYISKTGDVLNALVNVSFFSLFHNDGTCSKTTYLISQIQDITEQRLAQQDLIRMNTELKKVSQYKSEFLANMSHELKTPLTSILILTDELLSKAFGDLNPTQLEYLDDIQGSAKELLGLINDLLNFSKIESGKMSFRMSDVEIGEVVRGVIKKMDSLTRAKGITFKTNICNEQTIIADSRLVERLVSNLLANAIKFSPENSSIKINVQDVSHPAQGITIKIKDYGPGIPENEQDKIFGPFYQVNGGLTKEFGGTGLGLALVKKIADLHTGLVSVESKEGEGAAFTVFLPLHPTLDDDLD